MQAPDEELIPTRASLIHRLKDLHDHASWQRFFDIYWKLIYGVARQAGLTDTEAQDVVQETMVAVAKHVPEFKYNAVSGSFKTWLLNMTRWRIIDEFRKRAKLPDGELMTEEATTQTAQRFIDPASHALDALWENEWQTNLLTAATDRVKRRVEPQNYQLFDFYVNKEWPAERVAQSFNVPISQVYLAKHRVTELLKAEVSRIEQEMV